MDTHWRNSMKPARFFFLDARAAVPFVFALLHLRWYTLVIAAVTTLVFYILETRGLNFVAALRAFRVWLVTKKRPNVKHSDRTRMVDYGFEKATDMDDKAPPVVPQKGSPAGKGANRTKSPPANRDANQSAAAKQKKTVRPAATAATKN